MYKKRGEYHSFCALGGVMTFDSSRGIQGGSKSDAAILALFSALPEKCKEVSPIPAACVGNYNDAKERKKAEIRALYDRAMILVENDAIDFEGCKCLENEDL
jgi:hypothetical protein